MGTTIQVMVSPEISNESAGVAMAPGAAKDLIIAAGKWAPKGPKSAEDKKKKENSLPTRSLVKSDLEKSDEQLVARVLEVSKALGDTKARGRIGSLGMMRDGVKTFNHWWKEASPASKTRLITDEKHFKDLTPEDKLRIAKLVPKCPFRGDVPAPSAAAGEDDATQD